MELEVLAAQAHDAGHFLERTEGRCGNGVFQDEPAEGRIDAKPELSDARGAITILRCRAQSNAMPDDDLPAWDDPDDPRVCFCWRVHRQRLRAAIERGAETLADLAEATRAGTGCGTCRVDLIAMLRERSICDETGKRCGK
jgi:bacterioferritin-associated ferredoxin